MKMNWRRLGVLSMHPGQAAADVAKAYLAAVEGKQQGQVLDPRLVQA